MPTAEKNRHCTGVRTVETRRAIVAAEQAQTTWAAKNGKEPSAFLRHWHTLIAENIDDLGVLITKGKPLAEAKGEISKRVG